MIDFNKDNYAKNLPDSFKKDIKSNNYKILELERLSIEEHLNNLYSIYEIFNIDNAYGKTVDKYGERVGLKRGNLNDKQYIAMIKANIMRMLGNGTYSSVLNSICTIFGCEPISVYIEESNDPCCIERITLPLNVLNINNINVQQAIDTIKTLLPITIQFKNNLNLEGTFEFGTISNNYDNEKGFGNIEQTIGGFFGSVIEA